MISRETIRGGFQIKNLGEVVEFLDSKRRPITASNRVPGPYPYYGANGQQDSVVDYIFDEPLILLAEDGGLFDQPDRGIAYAIAGKTWVNNHAHVLRALDDVEQEYLVRVLENYDVTPWITGSTRAKLTKAGASRIQIPLPPLEEQKRIAGILDAADILRAKRREALAKLDDLLQSTFLDMFGDPVTNPKGWEVCKLADLGKEKGAIVDGPFGSAISVKTDYVDEGDVPVVRTKNVSPFQFVTDDLKFITEEKFKTVSRSEVLPGDIILTKVGTIGHVCFFPESFTKGVLSTTGSCRIRPDSSKVNSVYLARYLHAFRPQMLGIAATGVQPFLNMKHIKGFPVFLPPLDLQQRFAEIVSSVEEQKAKMRKHLEQLDDLFASLQQRAFRGDL